MNLDELVAALGHIAELLELDGANAFRTAAYTRAARVLPDYRDTIEELIANDRLTEIEGIGRGLAEKITEFAETGRIAELEELRARIPQGLVDMLRIPGFGAKKARAVHQQLGIDSVDALATACADGRVAMLKGFGEKSAARILEGIEQLRRYSGRHRIDTATLAARPILAALRAHPAVQRAEPAGSLRRGRETVKDLDFVVATDSPTVVMEFFTSLPSVSSVLSQGDTKASVLVGRTLQADLRCVRPDQFAYTLAHFTGSKEHNTRLRQRARQMGMKLNEYGLFPDGADEPLPAATEADVHRHLGLAYIHPELREDRGEVEAAEADTLPALVERRHLRGLMHLHTVYSDGRPHAADYAEWAHRHHIEWMGIADHSRSLVVANGLSEERVLQQHAEIDRLNAMWIPRGVRLLKGIESDILLDGSLDYQPDFLARFEFIVASVHTHFNLTEAEQTARIRRAIDNPHTTIIGHPTGRLVLARDPYPVDQHEIIRAAAAAGVAIEINANPSRLDLDWRLVHFAIDQGCRLTIGPDAHSMDGLEDVEYGLLTARKGWATPDVLLNCLSVDDFLAFARRRRTA